MSNPIIEILGRRGAARPVRYKSHVVEVDTQVVNHVVCRLLPMVTLGALRVVRVEQITLDVIEHLVGFHCRALPSEALRLP